jgi:hypothetical protein
MTSFISNLDSGPGEGGVKGKYDIRVTTNMKEKYSLLIEQKNVLHGTILCQNGRGGELPVVRLPRQRRTNISLYVGLRCNCRNMSASRIYLHEVETTCYAILPLMSLQTHNYSISSVNNRSYGI